MEFKAGADRHDGASQGQRKPGRGILAILIVLGVVLAGAAVAVVAFRPAETYKFHVTVTSIDPATSYQMTIPTPINEDGSIAAFIRTSPGARGEITGVGAFETERGWALIISARGPIELTWIGAAALEGGWPLPWTDHFPGGNADFSLWTSVAPQITNHTIGLVDVDVQAPADLVSLSLTLTMVWSRGPCDSLIHQVGTDQSGSKSRPVTSIYSECL